MSSVDVTKLGAHAENTSCQLLMQGNTIPYHMDPFWRTKWCPGHSSDGTLKCCACSRLQPRGEEWVTELDGRTVCLDCLSTIVRDTADAQPLYDQVRSNNMTGALFSGCWPGWPVAQLHHHEHFVYLFAPDRQAAKHV